MGQVLEMEGCGPLQFAHVVVFLSLVQSLWWWFWEQRRHLTVFLHSVEVWLNC